MPGGNESDYGSEIPLAQIKQGVTQQAETRQATDIDPPQNVTDVAGAATYSKMPMHPHHNRRMEDDPPTFEWESTNNLSPKNIPFTGQESINVPIPGNGTPFDYFFFVIFLLNAVETNRFAEQYTESTELPHIQRWESGNRPTRKKCVCFSECYC